MAGEYCGVLKYVVHDSSPRKEKMRVHLCPSPPLGTKIFSPLCR